MKKQKSIGNKGFSLVELIIVIAIMAILVGVMAPQLMKYVEKTNVSNDVQVADSVRTAIKTAMLDPSVISEADSQTQLDGFTGSVKLDDLADTTAFEKAVWETLTGSSADGYTAVKENLKSKGASTGDIYFSITGNDVTVWITNTNKEGSGKTDGTGTSATTWIVVPTNATPGSVPTT